MDHILINFLIENKYEIFFCSFLTISLLSFFYIYSNFENNVESKIKENEIINEKNETNSICLEQNCNSFLKRDLSEHIKYVKSILKNEKNTMEEPKLWIFDEDSVNNYLKYLETIDTKKKEKEYLEPTISNTIKNVLDETAEFLVSKKTQLDNSNITINDIFNAILEIKIDDDDDKNLTINKNGKDHGDFFDKEFNQEKKTICKSNSFEKFEKLAKENEEELQRYPITFDNLPKLDSNLYTLKNSNTLEHIKISNAKCFYDFFDTLFKEELNLLNLLDNFDWYIIYEIIIFLLEIIIKYFKLFFVI